MAVSPRSAGTLHADIEVDGSKVPRQFEEALQSANVGTRRTQQRIGRDIGRNIITGFRSNENAFVGSAEFFAGRFAQGILGGRSRRLVRRAGISVARAMAEGLAAEGSTFASVLSGLFTGFQKTLGPIIGSIFNVSGRGGLPMMALLVTFIGALVALILGLVQGLHAATTLLATIPNLLLAIGLQAAALFFIFNGFFEAVGQLSAAKNVNELNQALKGTNKEMAGIIVQLFPFKKLFGEIGESAKTAFFGGLGTIFTDLYNAFTRTNSLMYSMTTIAGGLATVVKSLLGYFATDEFNTFMKDLADATTRWLEGFGPALAAFVGGLTRFGIATLPYVEWFGEKFNEWITSIGEWFDEKANPDSGFLKWLEDAKDILKEFGALLGEIWETIKIFLKNLDEAGDTHFLTRIKEAFESLNEFFDSDIGKEAMRGLIRFVLLCLGLAASLIITLGILLAAFNVLWQFVKTVIEGLVLLFQVLQYGWDAFMGWLGDKLGDLTMSIGRWIEGAKTKFNTWLGGVPAAVVGFFANVGMWLYDAGVDLIQGLINGAIDRLPFFGPAVKAALRAAGLGFLFGGGDSGGAIQHKTPAGGTAAPGAGGGGGGGPAAPPAGSILHTTDNAAGLQGPTTISGSTRQTSVAMGSGAVQIIFQSNEPPTQEQAKAVGQTASTEYLTLLNKLSARTM